jgi:hypothetical protein
MPVPVTLHPLCRAVSKKSLACWAEVRHHGPVVLFQVYEELPLSGVEYVDPFKALKDPSPCRSLGRIPFDRGRSSPSISDLVGCAIVEPRKPEGEASVQKGHDPPLQKMEDATNCGFFKKRNPRSTLFCPL